AKPAAPALKQDAALRRLEPAFEEAGERKQLQEALDKNAEGERDLLRADGKKRMAIAIRNDFAAVRVYAHEVRSNRQPGERSDFAETLFWHAGIKTDDKGQATVEFGLSDAVT